MTETLAKLLTYGLPFIVLFMGLVWIIDVIFFAKNRRQKAESVDPVIVEYSKSFFPVLCFVFVMRSFLFEPFQIPSGSMLSLIHI
jgi:signal peptidase I